MASSLITGAISLLLIIIAGYVVATGILMIAESTINTQSEMNFVYESIQQTIIGIWEDSSEGTVLDVKIVNNGSTTFNLNDENFEIYVGNKLTNITTRYSTSAFTITPINDIVNKGFWDPYEVITIYTDLGYTPNWFKIVTPNGVSASTIIEL